MIEQMPEKRISMESISCKKAIRCTTPSCPCECFSPAKNCLRTCDTCKHGWVAHAIQSDVYALDKLGYRHIFNVGLQVEIVQPNIVFDIASLMLYGAQATPIRLKILLDRLFSVLQHEEVLQVLHGFGWTYEDYARGYILQNEDNTPETDTAEQEASGRVLDKWVCATREEEYIIMQQFLRFGETKSIAQEIILADTKERQDLYFKQSSSSESEIKKFIERSNMTMQNLVRPFDVRHLFGARLPYVGSAAPNRLMSPPIPGFSTPSSSPRDLRPPLISVSASSPVTSTPLSRLQTMQPFDYRRESSSPLGISPGDKQASTRESSPKSDDSPQNLSIVSSAASHSTPPHTPYTPHSLAEMKTSLAHIPMMPQSISLSTPPMMLPTLPTLPGHHTASDGVINFSIKEDPDRKNKHLRKSTNPIKRNWIPDANFGSPMIGPNGKKRVLCTACNKTFCDKGALKIHYSAVHLKEMHKCSVDGCTMMFSSRRSRNRHSANPNPKLHMPQKRPKIPDGATIVDDGSGVVSTKRPISSPPSLLLAQSMITRSPVNLGESPDAKSFYAESGIQMPVFPSALKRLKLDHDDSDDEGPKDLSLPVAMRDTREFSPSPRNMSLPLLRQHQEMGSSYEGLQMDTPSKDSQDGSISEGEKLDSMASSSPGLQRSQNRRKNIPTRCAPPADRFNLHGELVEKSGEEQEVGKQNGVHGEADIRHKLMPDTDVDMEDYADRSDSKLVIDDDEDDDEDDIDKNDTGEVLDFSMNALDVSEGENISIVSGHESDGSFASNDSSDMAKSIDDADIPVDKDNPKQCVTCGKSFLNLFGMKIHYKNVHLKLMHTCSVEGCSASFPSKRSRDRHSANLYLHRKLLSTSDEKGAKDETDDNQNFRADVIQKLYQFQNMTEKNISDKDIQECQSEVLNGNKTDIDNENDISKPDENNEGSGSCDELESDKTNGNEDEDELGQVNDDGMVTCHICNVQVRDNLVLKEHFEVNHPKEMYQCTIQGCEKIFSTRKSRNRHSQNHNLHKSISPNGRAIAV